jgi:aspartate/methionine/tyrosine aminotransferase
MIAVNHRAQAITPFHVMRLLARAKELEAAGRDIVHMEIGEPDFLTPAPILHAAQQAIATGKMHYTSATGLPILRERIAAFYQQRYGITVAPQRIVITPGASGALLLALAAVLDVGQEIVLSDPGYPCNRNMAEFLGARARAVPVDASSAYQLTAALLQDHWTTQTRAVLLASPSNPTGTIIAPAQLRDIATLVAAQDGTVLVDEIYHGLTYDHTPQSVLNITDKAFVINSFSKYFGMTGWRLGWLVVPEDYRDSIERFAQNIYLAAPTPSQYAALAAFEPQTIAILEQRRQEFQRRRDFLLPALRQLGFEIAVEPHGAFYIYASCQRFSDNSLAFCETVLEQAGVAITPGIDFGVHQANTHVRFAYTTSMEKLAQGVDRLRQFLRN